MGKVFDETQLHPFADTKENRKIADKWRNSITIVAAVEVLLIFIVLVGFVFFHNSVIYPIIVYLVVAFTIIAFLFLAIKTLKKTNMK